ncbi:MAG: fibronectin type III domain-containing protein [Actinomycetota bacterium]|nr:fibronectin type III domain-containing protein [Actinomycetota bacterium]
MPGAPGAPTIVTASAGEGSATLSWQAPSSTGSSAITSYAVTASPGGQSLTTSGPWLVATFDGLVDGTSYTFTVAATNAR